MKTHTMRRVVLAWALSAAALPAFAAACPALLNHNFTKLQDGTPQSLCQYQGKVLLVVNTASYCGFTKQFDGLEKLYQTYKDRGLVVVGFPSNDFGEQDPGTEKEIAEFCRLTYGVKFPMMGKTDIAAPKTNPFYKVLIEKSGTRPKWNFYKYLIDRSGTSVESFNSLTAPDNKDLVSAIEERLAQPEPK